MTFNIGFPHPEEDHECQVGDQVRYDALPSLESNQRLLVAMFNELERNQDLLNCPDFTNLLMKLLDDQIAIEKGILKSEMPKLDDIPLF